MAMYAVDEQGQIYEVNPDVSKEPGSYRWAEPCDAIDDLTVGGAHSQFLSEHAKSVAAENMAIKQEDAIAREEAMGRKIRNERMRRQAASEQSLMENPDYQAYMKRRAYMQGCECLGTPRERWKELDHDQQAINHHMSGQRQNVAYRPSQGEISQLEGQRRLEMHLRGEALKNTERTRQEQMMSGSPYKLVKRG